MIPQPDIVAVLEREGVHVRHPGRSWCPLHKGNSPALAVYPDENRWFCFACGFGGDSVEFVRRRHNVDFKEALRILEIETGKPDQNVIEKLERSREINRRFEKWRRWYIGQLIDRIRDKENALFKASEEKLWERDEEGFWEKVHQAADVTRLEWKVRLLTENEVPVVKEIAREYFNADRKPLR